MGEVVRFFQGWLREPTSRLGDLGRGLASHLPLLVLGGAAVLAYRGLISYDPGSEDPGHLEGTEALLFSPTDHDPSLILGLTAWLIYRRRWRLASAPTGGMIPLATLLLAGALALALWSHYVAAPELLIPSLSLTLLGAATSWKGLAGLRVMLLPACFLLLAYRLPGVLINQVVFPLQIWTAEATAWLLDLFGIPAVQWGDQIITRRAIFQVIESCAGLGAIQTLLMSSIVYAELLSRTGVRAVLLVLAAPLLGIVVNQLRVFSIVLNPYSEIATIHTLQGLVMVVLGVLLIAGLDWILHLRRDLPAFDPEPQHVRGPAGPWRRLALPLVCLAGIVLGQALVTPWSPPRDHPPRLSMLPAQLEGWQAEGLKLERDFVGSVGFSEWVHRHYRSGEDSVVLFLGADDRMSPRQSLLSPKTVLPGSGWVVERQFSTTLDDVPVEAAVMRSRTGRFLVFHRYEGVDKVGVELLRSALALDRSPLRRSERAMVLRASTPLDGGGLEEGEQRLREFLRIVRRALPSTSAATHAVSSSSG